MAAPSTSMCIVPTWPEVARFTLLDGCGRPRFGPSSSFVTDAFSQVGIAQNITEGEAFTLTKANGGTCCSVQRPDTVNNDTWTFDMCGFDSELWSSLNDNYTQIYDYFGRTVGFSEGYNLSSNNSVFVELFLNTCATEGGECEEDATADVEGQWLWVGAGKLKNWRRGDEITFGSEANPIQLQAVTESGAQWGTGPYPVMLDLNGQPASFANPIGSDRRINWAVITVEPPEPTCGAQPLSNPNAVTFVVSCVEGSEGRTIEVTLQDNIDPEAIYVVDWGDGTATDIITGATATHTYAASFLAAYDETYVGVWDSNATILYRAQKISLPCANPSITVTPLAGTAPLQVVATVNGCPTGSDLSMNWLNTVAAV
jgi:hypothetical protein